MNRRTIFVIDTSALIIDPDIFYRLGDNLIVVPTAVIKELDGLKRNIDPDDPTAKAARKVSRFLDELGGNQDIASGAHISTGAYVCISKDYTIIDELASHADNRIVGTSIRLNDERPEEVVLVSTDANMRNITRAYGITAVNYPQCKKLYKRTALEKFLARVITWISKIKNFQFYSVRKEIIE
jgi:PhoH-like ATPase